MSAAPNPPPFEEPWHAEVFAVTVALQEAGHFSWPDWVDVFGAQLKTDGATRALDGGSDYFTAWVRALEHMLISRKLATQGQLQEMKANWESAYLSTPHGAPVHPEPMREG
ncbi:nitrile hydratase accessory protein [Primorskyibacter sp. S187A]|uniref:nitrile hydratase accessory protein n=1 Tax=Primorskyibacter sp. S187A TaxID=3415130 RepID=UPI003C7DBF25